MTSTGDDRRLDELLARTLPAHAPVDWDRLRQRISAAITDDDTRREQRLDDLLADDGLNGAIDWMRQRRRIAAAAPAPHRRWRITAVAIGLAAAAVLPLALLVPGPRSTAPRGFARVTLTQVSDVPSGEAHGYARVALSGPEDALLPPAPTPPGEMFLMIQSRSSAPGASRVRAGA